MKWHIRTLLTSFVIAVALLGLIGTSVAPSTVSAGAPPSTQASFKRSTGEIVVKGARFTRRANIQVNIYREPAGKYLTGATVRTSRNGNFRIAFSFPACGQSYIVDVYDPTTGWIAESIVNSPACGPLS